MDLHKLEFLLFVIDGLRGTQSTVRGGAGPAVWLRGSVHGVLPTECGLSQGRWYFCVSVWTEWAALPHGLRHPEPRAGPL